MRSVLLFFICIASISAQAQLLSDSLQTHFKFDSSYVDISGKSRTLNSFGGVSYTTDRFGNPNRAVKFDGNNDYLRIDDASFLVGNQFSMATWIRIDAWPSNGGNSLFTCLGSSTYDHGITSANNYLGYSGITAFSYNSGSGNASTWNPNFSVSLNTWYHVALVRDGMTLRLYINGQLQDIDSVSSNAGFTGTNKLWLGCRIGTTMFANGAMDDFRSYNRSLTATEIANIYTTENQNPTPPYVPGVACTDYRFQNNTLDSGGQNYHLTNHGGTLTQDRFGNANSAILLDGVNDYLELSNADSLATGEITIAAWVKPIAMPSNNAQGSIVCLGDNTFDHGLNFANNYLNFYDGFTAYSYTTANSNASAYDSSGTLTINTNTWYHIAMTRNDSVHILYINGVVVDYQLVNGPAGFNSTGNKLWIGARYGSGSFFNGVVDDVHVCNRAWDSASVVALYTPLNQNPTPPYVPGVACTDYRFQNNTLDSGGQNYHLTNHGGTLTQDRFGNANSAILLDGVNDYLELSNADSMATGEITIAAWVKPIAMPSNNAQGSIVCLGDNTFDHGLNFANNYLNFYDGFTAYSYTTANSNASAYDSSGTLTINTNTWYHIAMTRNDSVHILYINGVVVDYQLVNGPAGFNSTGNKLWIGARYGSGSFFNGVVDDVHVCNRAWDSASVVALYTSLQTQVKTIEMDPNLLIYPNPNNGSFNIRSSRAFDSVLIYDLSGKIVAADHSDELHLNLEAGIYYVSVYSGNIYLGSSKLVIH